MASVVEHATGTGTAAITSVPQAGDTVVVMLAKNNTWSNASVSGLGGTWTKIYEVVSAAASTDTGLQIWVCTNATTAGTVTPATAPASTHLFLVRGVSATRRIRMYNLGDTNMRDSPAMMVGPGQVVIDLSITYSSAGTWPTTDVLPATGWTFGPNTTKNLFFSYGHAFRVPTTEAVHRLTPTSSGGGSRQTMLVLGDPDTPRAVDVIEEVQMIWNGTNTMTGELATTPQPGDVLVATYASWGSPFVSISGLGATWAIKHNVVNGGGGHVVAVGTGATSAGTVTVNLTGQTAQVVNVWLVRGLDNTTTAASTVAVTPTETTPVNGPSMPAGGAKQFVVDFYNFGAPGGAPPSYPVSPTPTDRWQPAQSYRHQSFGFFRNAFRVPVETSPALHQVKWATNVGTNSGTVYLTQAVIGGAPIPTTTSQFSIKAGFVATAKTLPFFSSLNPSGTGSAQVGSQLFSWQVKNQNGTEYNWGIELVIETADTHERVGGTPIGGVYNISSPNLTTGYAAEYFNIPIQYGGRLLQWRVKSYNSDHTIATDWSPWTSFTAVGQVSASLPLLVGFQPKITQNAPRTSAELPFTIGFGISAIPLLTTKTELPVNIGLEFSAYQVSVIEPYTDGAGMGVPVGLSGLVKALLPPPTPPVDLPKLPDPLVAPTLTKSDTTDGALEPGTYRYSYAGWRGNEAQVTAPSPTADITIGVEDTVTLSYPKIPGAQGYLVYREKVS